MGGKVLPLLIVSIPDEFKRFGLGLWWGLGLVRVNVMLRVLGLGFIWLEQASGFICKVKVTVTVTVTVK